MIQGPMRQSLRQLHCYAIIPHPVDPLVFMQSDSNGWLLPHLVPDRHHFAAVYQINQAMAHQLDITLTTLRCLSYQIDRNTRQAHAVYALENHSPDWGPPPDSHWVAADELDDLILTIPQHRSVLTTWFAEIKRGEAPSNRRPWSQVGWFNTAVHWIKTKLDELGIKPTGPIIQRRVWGISCILQVETTEGRVFFRAVPPISAHEPQLMHQLAQQYPTNFPQILAIESTRNWILMREIKGRLLVETLEERHWEEAVTTYAQIQIDLAHQSEQLLAWGCPDRRLEKLGEDVKHLVHDTAALKPDHPDGMSASEIEMLQKYVPVFQQMCEQLGSYNLPHTLEHGDFHPNNIKVTDKSCVYFDWGESSLSHPFFSLIALEYYLEYLLPDTKHMWDRLRRAYLQPWTDYESQERLQTAYALARPLAALHTAVTFHRLTRQLEPKAQWEMEIENGLPFALKTLINSLGQVKEGPAI